MATATLTAKQKEFAHFFSSSHNSAEAARAAGYSVVRANRTGYELLRKPDVAALITTLDDEKREASGVDEPWVVDKLVAIVEQSLQGRPRTNGLGEPILDPAGEPVVDVDYTAANRALQTLSKIAGLQVHRTESVSKEWRVVTLKFDRELDDDV